MHDLCAVLHGDEPFVQDADGCALQDGHAGPHEFIDQNGQRWNWETDLACTCAHCMKCEGDYCTTYWRAADRTALSATMEKPNE